MNYASTIVDRVELWGHTLRTLKFTFNRVSQANFGQWLVTSTFFDRWLTFNFFLLISLQIFHENFIIFVACLHCPELQNEKKKILVCVGIYLVYRYIRAYSICSKLAKKNIYFNFIMIIFSINDTWMISNLKRESNHLLWNKDYFLYKNHEKKAKYVLREVFNKRNVIQSDKKGFWGDVVLDNFNMAYRDEDSIWDQKYEMKILCDLYYEDF